MTKLPVFPRSRGRGRPCRHRSGSRTGRRARGLLVRNLEILPIIFGIHLEEVVEDDHHHGTGAKKDGQTVELLVGDHGEGGKGWSRFAFSVEERD